MKKILFRIDIVVWKRQARDKPETTQLFISSKDFKITVERKIKRGIHICQEYHIWENKAYRIAIEVKT